MASCCRAALPPKHTSDAPARVIATSILHKPKHRPFSSQTVILSDCRCTTFVKEKEKALLVEGV